MSTFQTLLAMVVLIYALSVIVQALQEAFKRFYSSKAKTMAKTFTEFMGDHLPLDKVQDALKQRGLDLPALEHFNKEDFRHLLDAIQGLDPKLQGIVADAQATFEQRKDNAASAFEAARAKFDASYTKHNKMWVRIFSAVVALVLNANLIFLYQELAADQAMSQTIAATADKLVQGQGGGAARTPGATTTPPGGQQGNANSQPEVKCPLQTSSKSSTDPYTDARNCVKELVNKYPILVRWSEKDKEKWPGSWFAQLGEDCTTNGLPQTIIGLVLMWLLVSLGAPFWNDILKGATGVNNQLNNGRKSS